VAYRNVRSEMLGYWQLVLFCAAIVRGSDYVVRDVNARQANATWTLTVVERSGPLWLWGALFISAGTVGLLTELFVRYIDKTSAPVGPWVCHVILFALYLTIGLAMIPPTFEQGWGFSAVSETLTVAVCHLVFVMQRRSRRAHGHAPFKGARE
jgi:hypothetical protein